MTEQKNETVITTLWVALAGLVLWGGDQQVGTGLFWWGVLSVAIPLAWAEVAVARRAGRPLISGWQHLTREADAARGWRVLSSAACVAVMVLLPLLAGWSALALAQAAGHTLSSVSLLGVASLVLVLGALRVFSRVSPLVWLLPVAGLSTWALLPVASPAPVMPVVPALPPFWAGAALMGGGLLWRWSCLSRPRTPSAPLHTAAQGLIVLGLAVGLVMGQGPAVSLMVAVLLFLLMAAPLEAAVDELAPRVRSRQAAWAAVVGMSLVVLTVCCFVEVITWHRLRDGLAVWAGVSGLVLAIYTGWVMKLTHARKALAFRRELLYNLWRIAIRWVLPLAIGYQLVRVGLSA